MRALPHSIFSGRIFGRDRSHDPKPFSKCCLSGDSKTYRVSGWTGDRMGRAGKGPCVLTGVIMSARRLAVQPFILLLAIWGAIVDWRYKKDGGMRPTRKDRIFF